MNIQKYVVCLIVISVISFFYFALCLGSANSLLTDNGLLVVTETVNRPITNPTLLVILSSIISLADVLIILFVSELIIRRLKPYLSEYHKRKFSNIIRSADGSPSLSLFQFILWMSVILFVFLAYYFTGLLGGMPATVESIPDNLIMLMAIVTSGPIISLILSYQRYTKPTSTTIDVGEQIPPISRMLMENNRFSVARLQIFIWTLIATSTYIVYFFSLIVHTPQDLQPLAFPDISLVLVIVTAISLAYFLISKAGRSEYLETSSIEGGIEGGNLFTGPSTDYTDRVASELINIAEKVPLDLVNIRRSQEIIAFIYWYKKEIGGNPDWFLSKISKEFIQDILKMTTPYYSRLFMKDIVKKVDEIITTEYGKYCINKSFKLSELNHNLTPLEFYLDLETKLSDQRSLSARLTFRIDTGLQMKNIKAQSTLAGTKIKAGAIIASLRVMLARISITKSDLINLYKPIELQLLSESKKFEVSDLTIFGNDRDVLIWIDKHKANDPLIVGEPYDLMISVTMLYADSLSLTSYKLHSLKIYACGEAFETHDEPMNLILPKQGNSKPISIRIYPKYPGNQNLDLLIYYRQNIVQTISITLTVEASSQELYAQKWSKSEKLEMHFREEEKYIHSNILTSRLAGFQSILEIEKRIDGEEYAE